LTMHAPLNVLWLRRETAGNKYEVVGELDRRFLPTPLVEITNKDADRSAHLMWSKWGISAARIHTRTLATAEGAAAAGEYEGGASGHRWILELLPGGLGRARMIGTPADAEARLEGAWTQLGALVMLGLEAPQQDAPRRKAWSLCTLSSEGPLGVKVLDVAREPNSSSALTLPIAWQRVKSGHVR
jgi:hypothetical protein